MSRLHLMMAILVGPLALLPLGCDPMAECIEAPAPAFFDADAQCEPLPDAVELDDQIVSASASVGEDGTLTLTWSSYALTCGTHARELELPDSCATTGWALSVEIPSELAVVGTIDLAAHPEVFGTMTVAEGLDGAGASSIGDEPFFMGELELLDIGEGCVTGILRGFGTGRPDPTFGGPELDGGFRAERCDGT